MFIHQGRHAGWIEVICGPMFSGKTEELIRRLRLVQIAKQRVQIFKPLIDNRYEDDHIISHSSQRFVCQPVSSPAEILSSIADSTRVVGIDEAQFFSEEVVDVCQKLAERGLRVIVAGLDQDFRGEPFGPMPRLLAVAESVIKLTAVCVVCGGIASKTQRLIREAATIVVGSGEVYEARCRACFDPDFTLARSAPPVPMSKHTRN